MTDPAGPKTAVTVVVVTFNSAAHIAATLDALTADPDRPDEIVVVDSASTDDTAKIVSGYSVRWVPLEQNVGFGAAVNAAAAEARGEVLVVLNHDAVARPGWLPPLVAALDDEKVGAAMATIELADDPGRFNTSGGAVAVSGLAWITDLGEPIPDDEAGPVAVPFPSGAAFAVRLEVWRRLGGFREDFFMYHEDTDLGWRLRLAGFRSVRVPQSRVAHRYDFGRNPEKLVLLERNRLRMIATNYRRSTLALLAPALLLHEAGVVWVALRDGWFGAKASTWVSGLASGAAYRRVQETRLVGDAEILRGMSTGVATVPIPDVRVPRGAGVVDGLTAAYVRAVLPLVEAIDRKRRAPTSR